MTIQKKELTKDFENLQRVLEIGILLSSETNSTKLLEKILKQAKMITRADAGTIYSVTADRKLHFEIMWADSLNLYNGGSLKTGVPFPDLPLFLEDGSPNSQLMATYAANHGETINVEDAYNAVGFDFRDTHLFDERTGYRTKAAVTVPIKNHEKDVVAVMQLINPSDPQTHETISFTKEDQKLLEALASLAGVALSNSRLIESLKELFEGLASIVSAAIDEKSPVTGSHSKRVPVIVNLLAKAINETKEGPLKDVFFNEDQLYELKIAALLHDCGKITTPVHIIEKSKKLETITDRIQTIDTRFEVLKRDAEIESLQNKLKWYEEKTPHLQKEAKKDFDHFDLEYHQIIGTLNFEQNFLHQCNEQQTYLSEENEKKIHSIGRRGLYFHDRWVPLLTADEIENLCIKVGNLTEKEREIIENHVILTQRMLSQLKYPKNLQLIPEIAGSHHEWVNGKGYPRGLTKEQMPIQSRLLAIADVFEALSAPDRPYKIGHPISSVLIQMQKMVDEGHLDAEIFEVFVKQRVAQRYAERYLSREQIDV